MTGPSLAPLIIPIAGTLFLTVWLTLVFYAGRLPRRAAGQSGARPRRSGPGRVGCLAPARRPRRRMWPVRQTPGIPAPQRSGDVRVVFEVER